MKPALRRYLTLCGIAVGLAAAFVVAGWMLLVRTNQAGHAGGSQDPSVALQTSAWKNEEHWAVDQMARDVIEMLLFAAGETPEAYDVEVAQQDQKTHRYKVTAAGPRLKPPLETELVLQDHLWSPSGFAALTRALAERLGGVRDAPEESGTADVLTALLDVSPPSLEKVQQTVSAALNRNPRSADRHEQAAAVLATVALYDPSWTFWDARATLGRMAAHLAAAECLRGAPGARTAAGRMASISVLYLTGQVARALSALEALSDEALGKPWRSALYRLCTRDFRSLDNPKGAAPAEWLAAFRGRARLMDADSAYEWALGAGQEEQASYVDFVTIVEHASVGLGHGLVAQILPLLHADVASVWRLRSGSDRPLDPERLCQLLNEPPARAYQPERKRLEVVGWGIWASRFQASVLEAAHQSFEFRRTMLSDREGAGEYLDAITRDYSALVLFPLLRLRLLQELNKVDPRARSEARRVVQSHTERISEDSFVCVSTGGCGTISQPAPSYRDWLTVPVPFGTLYNAGSRCWQMTEPNRFTRADVDEWLKIDPYDPWLMVWSLRMTPGPWKPEHIDRAFGTLKNFGGTFYADWMTKAYPRFAPEQVSLLRTLAAKDPSNYFDLAHTLVALGRYPEAERAFLKGRELSSDAVLVSNNMRWLVVHLERTGRHALAETIARESADVYSSGGLETMASLREVQGRLKEAEAWLKRDSERYELDNVLHDFYRRNAKADPQYESRAQALVAKHFPRGLEKVDSALEKGPPRRGVLLPKATHEMARAGIDQRAIVVAVDGYRVEDTTQFHFIRAMTPNGPVPLVVYQKGRYETRTLDLVNRYFGVDLGNYEGPPVPAGSTSR
jgi:tetratricopeptide (TPR) repeat protein